MAGSHAGTQGVHMRRTWSPPGGMDLERQDVAMAHLPLSPVMYEARPFTQELPLGVAGQGGPSLLQQPWRGLCLLPCPGALTHPALDCCWATTPLWHCLPPPPPAPCPCPSNSSAVPQSFPPSQQPGRYNHKNTKRSFTALSCFLPQQSR